MLLVFGEKCGSISLAALYRKNHAAMAWFFSIKREEQTDVCSSLSGFPIGVNATGKHMTMLQCSFL